MRTKEFEITIDDVTVKATLRAATNGDNMRRHMLAAQAATAKFDDYADQVVADLIFPRCVACVMSGEITIAGETKLVMDLTNVEFVNLPSEIGEAWLTAALELNPTWNIQPVAESPSAKKKD
jgi:hypothetical protein